jgi:hypothetical protein
MFLKKHGSDPGGELTRAWQRLAFFCRGLGDEFNVQGSRFKVQSHGGDKFGSTLAKR